MLYKCIETTASVRFTPLMSVHRLLFQFPLINIGLLREAAKIFKEALFVTLSFMGAQNKLMNLKM